MVPMNLFSRQNRDADTENGYVDTGGEGESDSNWEIGIDI